MLSLRTWPLRRPMLPSRIFIAGGDTRNTRESSQVTAPAVPDRTRQRTAVADGPSSSTKSGSGVPRDSAQACATMYLGINRWAANASACHSMGGFLGYLALHTTDGSDG